MTDYTHPLVGKKIAAVYLSTDQQAIKFVLDDGKDVDAFADGDCCSHSWIEDVLDPESLIGKEVLAVEDLDLPDALCGPTKTGYFEGEMRYYGCAIKTAGGVCTIAYRNSSNGYYGGNLSWPGDYYYGGVFGQNEQKGDWKLIAGKQPEPTGVADAN